MKSNDILWKSALEDLFEDFLRFFYPDADSLFDMNKGFEYLDKELEQLFPPDQDEYKPRYVDKLVKAFTHDGNEKWVLIHIEVQNYKDDHFAKRMFQYYYRILDKYDKPITAFALLCDSNKMFHPDHYEREFLGTRLYYVFNTYKIIDQCDEALNESNNPFAVAILSAKLALKGRTLKDEQLFELAYDLAKRLLAKQFSKEKIRKLMNFLRFYVRFENKEFFTKFEIAVADLTERNNTMGIEEFLLDRAKKEGLTKGREKGIEEGLKKGLEKGLEEKREIVENLILKLGLSDNQAADIVNVPVEFVIAIRLKIQKH